MLKRFFCPTFVLAASIGALNLTGCIGNHPTAIAPSSNGPNLLDENPVMKAIATVGPSKSATTQPVNHNVTGTVVFNLTGDQIKFVAEIDGLAPNTQHGFHIHEKGDLKDPDLKSAGGHFNPMKEKHGGPDSPHHHAGDMGNLLADANGHAHLSGTLLHASFSGEMSILNRSVIIHSKPDDLKSQPAGESGARIAGGIIKASE